MKTMNEMIKKKQQLTPINQMIKPSKINYQNIQQGREGQLHEIQENLEVHNPNSVQKIFDRARGKNGTMYKM